MLAGTDAGGAGRRTPTWPLPPARSPTRGATSPWCRPSCTGCSPAPPRRRRSPVSTPCCSVARRRRSDLLDRARGRGVRVVTTYGMSETCGGCVYDGWPLDGVEVTLGRGRPGAVSADRCSSTGTSTSPSSPPRCCARDGCTRRTSAGSTTTGRLEVLGRLDDVVVSGGTNVPLGAVERRLRAHPAVARRSGRRCSRRRSGGLGWSRSSSRRRASSRRRPEQLRDFVADVHPREWAPREVVVRHVAADAGVRQARPPGLSRADWRRGMAEPGRERRVDVFSLPMTMTFRRVDHREGVLLYGPAGVGEFSPFWDYDVDESARWLAAALEAADVGFPEPLRDSVPVNCTVPAVSPGAGGGDRHRRRTAVRRPRSRWPSRVSRSTRTWRGSVPSATRWDPAARIRVDANGGWSVEQAVEAIAVLAEVGLEYVEQPVGTVEELAAVRRRVDVPIAADESIRRVEDPLRVVQPRCRRHRRAQGPAAGRGARLPAARRADRHPGRRVERARVVGRHRRRGRPRGGAARAALRLRSRHHVDVQPRPRSRADDPGRRSARRPTGGARPRAARRRPGRRGDGRPGGGSGWPTALPCSSGWRRGRRSS